MMAHPGKKLLFMGSEFGQFKEWDFQSALDWVLLEYDMHKKTQDFTRALNNFYLKNSPLWEIDFSWEGFSWIANDDYQQSIIAFRRMDKSGNEIIIVCNFCPVQRDNYRIGVPQSGSYKVVFNTDDTEFGGGGAGNKENIKVENIPMHGFDNSISFCLPAMSVLYFKHVRPRGIKKSDDKKPKATSTDKNKK